MNTHRKTRRDFLKDGTRLAAGAVLSATTVTGTGCSAGKARPRIRRKVIVIGMDGVDHARLRRMIRAGRLANFQALCGQGGYRPLGTSIPPQSPVAWSNFITGADPGQHGIFDFIHRDPARQIAPYFSGSRTEPGKDLWRVGEFQIPLPLWSTPPHTVLLRKGIPFWDYLDERGIRADFYDLPVNYPPSPSRHGHVRCLSGLGTPDMLGTYGTYQYFLEGGPPSPQDEPGGGGMRCGLVFENHRATARLLGPRNDYRTNHPATEIPFEVFRDPVHNVAKIRIQDHELLLKQGEWSPWCKLTFRAQMPWFLPDQAIHGICRFYLQQVHPRFRLYVTPINFDPSDPAARISEPQDFVKKIAQERGLFYTTGFQEDHKALSNGVFDDEEYHRQALYVLEERLALLDYALRHYDDGLLFFYFSSTDLMSHMFWWQSRRKHPVRTPEMAEKYNRVIDKLYATMDEVLGRIMQRYGTEATIIVMSDHGFSDFGRQFNLNTWLRDNGYLAAGPGESLYAPDIDWSRTRAYGLGINGLYLNLKGREREGIVSPGAERDLLLTELTARLLAVRDPENNQPVITSVYRTDRVYTGPQKWHAPDLVLGYNRGYRASWATVLGDLTPQVLLDNDEAWSADHCMDPKLIPGIFVTNRKIAAASACLSDVAPTILAEFGIATPPQMTGRDLFARDRA